MKKYWLLPAALAVLLAGSAHAQNALIDYQGYAWESAGFPSSNAGDALSIVASSTAWTGASASTCSWMK